MVDEFNPSDRAEPVFVPLDLDVYVGTKLIRQRDQRDRAVFNDHRRPGNQSHDGFQLRQRRAGGFKLAE